MALSSPSDPLAYAKQNGVPFVVRKFPPNVSNLSFPIPTIWVDTEGLTSYILLSKTNNQAIWVQITDMDLSSYINVVLGDAGAATTTNSIVSIEGDAGQGISTSGSGSVITITAQDATEALKGVMQLASAADIQSGTDATKAVTPSLIGPFESGTFTPEIDAAVTGTATYTNQKGYYVRQGSLVYISGHVKWTAIGTMSGRMKIKNLPFEVVDAVVLAHLFNAVLGNVPLTADYTQVHGNFLPGTTMGDINQAGPSRSLAGVPINPAGELYFSGQYAIG